MWDYRRRHQQQWPENVIPSVKPHDRGTLPRHDRPVNDDTGSPAKSPRSSNSPTKAADIATPVVPPANGTTVADIDREDLDIADERSQTDEEPNQSDGEQDTHMV
jgi:hypothetical protein